MRLRPVRIAVETTHMSTSGKVPGIDSCRASTTSYAVSFIGEVISRFTGYAAVRSSLEFLVTIIMSNRDQVARFSGVYTLRGVFVTLFFFQAEDGIRDWSVTGVQTCALPI